MTLPFKFTDELQEAFYSGQPVVALESTVITHGLPFPQNLQLARDMETEVKQAGAFPATIAIVDGVVHIGLPDELLQRLAQDKELVKVSSREVGPAIVKSLSGGTTVAATMLIADQVGIKVFATGGIGGVHRRIPGDMELQTWDVSADLNQLSRTQLIVVCAGAKAILDLPATLEYLETWSVPVIGYAIDEFPAFYSRSSGLALGLRCDQPDEVVDIARTHWEIGMRSAILVANPPPEEAALSHDQVDTAIEQALTDAANEGIRGQQVTPFLLGRMAELTHGSSIEANLSLLKNNARLAARIARAWVERS